MIVEHVHYTLEDLKKQHNTSKNIIRINRKSNY
jgi:hypothetical protein